jgi:lipopolysaccharide transport system ATP-binding protein
LLAVGDAAFQKKCLGKMGDVAREGRTVLFVSHNMGAVESLCQKAILLEGGKIITEGESNQVINKYLTGYNNFLSDVELSHIQRTGVYGEKVRFIKGFLVDSLNKKVSQYRLGDKIVICIDLLTTSGSHEELHVNVGINTIQHQIVTTLTSRTSHGLLSCPEGKTISLQVVLDSLVLSPGTYNLTLTVGRRGQAPLDMLQDVLSFTVNDTLTGTQVVPHPNLPGFVQADSSWTISIA